jgi:hypothetical protein
LHRKGFNNLIRDRRLNRFFKFLLRVGAHVYGIEYKRQTSRYPGPFRCFYPLGLKPLAQNGCAGKS